VHVMAAGMHQAGVAAGEIETGAFLDGQRVHVAAYGEGRARTAADDLRDDTGAADAGAAGDAKARQFGRHHAGGADFLKGEFRMGVQVAADGNQRRLLGLGRRADGGANIVYVAHGRSRR